MTPFKGACAEPKNLGPEVNSPGADRDPEVARDGGLLFFAGIRGGGLGLSDVWYVTSTCDPDDPRAECKPRPIGGADDDVDGAPTAPRACGAGAVGMLPMMMLGLTWVMPGRRARRGNVSAALSIPSNTTQGEVRERRT